MTGRLVHSQSQLFLGGTLEASERCELLCLAKGPFQKAYMRDAAAAGAAVGAGIGGEVTVVEAEGGLLGAAFRDGGGGDRRGDGGGDGGASRRRTACESGEGVNKVAPCCLRLCGRIDCL